MNIYTYEILKSLEGKIDTLTGLVQILAAQQEKLMAALDDKITALTAEVTRNTSVESSALTLINGFAAQLAAAIAAASNAGATTAQLQSLTDLSTTLTSNDDALAAAVAANTPAPPAPNPNPAP